MNPRRGRSVLPLVASLMIVLGWAARPSAAPSLRLEINGERAPVNYNASERGEARFASARALSWFGWQLSWDAESRALIATKEGVTVRIVAGAGQASVQASAEDPPRIIRFQPATFIDEEQLQLPAEAFEGVFKIAADWDDASKALRLGEVPAPAEEEVRAWCDALGIRNASVFHQSAFRIVTLKVTGGLKEVERSAVKEFGLIVRTNKAGSIQVYEKVNEEEAEPLLNEKGEIYPRRFDKPATPYLIGSMSSERWVLGATRNGQVSYIAIATNLKTKEDLLEILKRPPVDGEWAVLGITLTVKP